MNDAPIETVRYLSELRIRKQCVIIAISNQKGGVCKTVTAVNLAEGLARKNLRVLVVDMDGQANATTALGISEADIDQEYQSYDAAIGDAGPVRQIIRPSNRRGLKLDVIPGTHHLQAVDVGVIGRVTHAAFNKGSELAQNPDAAFDLKRYAISVRIRAFENLKKHLLTPVLEDYDFILIDCPPGYSLVTGMALVASDCVIIPLDSAPWAWQGARSAIQSFFQIKKLTGFVVRCLGFLLCKYKPRYKVNQQVREKLLESYPELVFESMIRESIYFTETSQDAQSVWDAKGRRSELPQDYGRLTDEVLSRLAKHSFKLDTTVPPENEEEAKDTEMYVATGLTDQPVAQNPPPVQPQAT